MAADSEQLDFVIRLLFPDAKVPPIDTSEAQAAIAKLQAMAKSAQASIAGSVAGMASAVGAPAVAAAAASSTGYGFAAPYTMSRGPGGGAVFTYPTPSISPAPSRGSYPWPAGPGFAPGGSGVNWANGAPGPGNWSMGGGNWALGPVRDPGSWAPSSLGSARGYDFAMMRDRVGQSSLYYQRADEAAGSLNKVAAGLTQITTAGTSLAAGLILLNKSIEANGDAWDNMQTRMVGWMNVVAGGVNGVRGLNNLSSGLGGAATRGVNMAAGMLNTAGFASSASILGRLGAPMGMAGTIGGGLAVGAGAIAVGYMSYQLMEADRQNQEALMKGQQLEAQRLAQRDSMLYNRIGAPEQLARVGIGLNADANRMMSAAGAMSFRDYDRFLTGSINDLTGRNAGLRSNWMGGNASDEGMTAARELADNLEMQVRLVGERGRKRQEEKQTQIEQLHIEREMTQLEQARAGATLRGMRGVTDRDWRRGLRLISQAERNGLDERTAMGIAAIPGMGGRAADWLDQRNQARIDSLPAEWRNESSRSSQQLDEIKKRLKDAEMENQSLLRSIGDNATTTAGLIKDLRTELDKVNRDLFQMKNRSVVNKSF